MTDPCKNNGVLVVASLPTNQSRDVTANIPIVKFNFDTALCNSIKGGSCENVILFILQSSLVTPFLEYFYKFVNYFCSPKRSSCFLTQQSKLVMTGLN